MGAVGQLVDRARHDVRSEQQERDPDPAREHAVPPRMVLLPVREQPQVLYGEERGTAFDHALEREREERETSGAERLEESQAAFAHERFLHEQHRATYAVRPLPPVDGAPDATGPLSIIGPFFSGSAASLRKGKPGWVNFAAVGFGWDKAKGQPHLTATLRVLDEDGKPALVKPSRGTIDRSSSRVRVP